MAGCVEKFLTFIVTILILETDVTATTEFSVEPPQCIATGRHPAPACYQYYDCVYVMWWWEAQLVTCPDNQCFDISLKACALASLVDCQFRTPLPGVSTTSTTTSTTTTTTPSPPTLKPGVPNCTGPGKHPAPSCYDYYECVQDVTLWKPVLTTCVVGYAFDIFIIACVPVKQCDCQNRLTTTTTTTTSVAPPIIYPPTCTGPGLHPAPACSDYYECIQDVWSWKPVLKSCVIGYAFDIFIIACVPAAQCDCQNRVTTTTTTTTSVAPPIIYPPSCTGPGKHPSQSCYGYYECVQEASWWTPVFKNCIAGYAFDIFIITCVPVAQCDCQNRVTTTVSTTTSTTVAPIVIPPKCTGPGRHPALSCYDYYECEQELWWWTPVLKNCVVGYAYDIFIVACVPVAQCDCQNRVTSTGSSTTSTTTLAPSVIGPPDCTGPGKHPATSCSDYYECEQELWWWKPVLKTCIVGYAFDVIIVACVPVKHCDCQNRVTTVAPPPTLPPPLVIPPSCSGPGKHPALSCYDYYECEQESWWWKPVLKTCVVGHAYDVFLIACVPVKRCDCQNRLTTPAHPTPSTTSLAPPILGPPSCTGPGKHPATSCSDYYECEQELWWWKPVLKSCVVGYAFDIFIITCVPVKHCDCQNRVTTTVSTSTSTTSLAPPVILPPSCYGPGKHPAQSCYDYYECEQELWWWKPVLKNCVVGYAFDIFIVACVPVKHCDCQHRVTTTVSTTTSTTTPAPPVIVVPSCPGPGFHPAPNCYQYYRCKQNLWWWEPVLETCTLGFAFDIFVIACAPVASVDCQHRITTTVSPTPRPTRPPPPMIEPTCTGPSRHPTHSCYAYYECVQVWWWWEPRLQSCAKGHAFDIAYSECRRAIYVDCHHRRTTTVRPPTTAVTPRPPPLPPVVAPSCFGPGKHPASICYQYYECVQVGWWWTPELKSCRQGEAFDVVLSVCYPSHVVDCQQRVTTTIAPPPTPPPRPRPPVPVCRGYSKHPAPLCYQYYECVQNWWWWEPKLKTCPHGEGFDVRKRRCFCAEAIGCRLPVTEPVCSEPGQYPARKCHQYYDCVSYFWWWRPELKNCPKGQGFATSVMRCVDAGYDCTLSDSSESSKENGSKENGSKEKGSKENTSKENTSKEKSSKEIDV